MAGPRVATLLVAGLALAGAARGAELTRGDDRLALALKASAADVGAFTGAADLTAELGPIQTDLAASIQYGRTPGAASTLAGIVPPVSRGSRLAVTAAWNSEALDLSIGAAQRRQETTSAVALTPTALQTQILANDDRSATLNAQLRPLADVSVKFAAQAASSVKLVGGTAASPSEQASDSLGLVTAAAWSLDTLALSTQVAVTRERVAWADERTARFARSSVTPRLVATFAPAPDTRMQLTAEHVLSPPVLLPAASDGSVRLQGGSEWRVALDARQPLVTGLSLSTALTLAARAGATEFGADAGGGQMPVTVAAGLGRKVEVGLTADLGRIGLDGATLTGTGTVQASTVADPMTGTTRRPSGEVPLQAKVAFTQALPLEATRFGIDTYVEGASDYYGVRDLTRVGTAAGLGAFVDYAPGPVRVQVRVDNLLGGERESRIDYYQGLRGASDIDRVERRAVGGRAVSLTVSGRV